MWYIVALGGIAAIIGIINVFNRKKCEYQHTPSSEGLAALIVDALVDAKIIKKEDLDLAIEIATEEINARKAMRDY